MAKIVYTDNCGEKVKVKIENPNGDGEYSATDFVAAFLTLYQEAGFTNKLLVVLNPDDNNQATGVLHVDPLDQW